ncbi:hypothetical protein K4F52_003926 [Lecanicillium sp. MT-2017a]|nr:hypothetical protein K4F52_003926 [Lecanicillium sp. MT-2017a]
MEPNEQLPNPTELPPLAAHDKAECRFISSTERPRVDLQCTVITPSELAYADLSLATQFDDIHHAAQESSLSSQQDATEFQAQSLLSLQLQGFTELTTDDPSVWKGDLLDTAEQSWQASPSPWSVQDQTQNDWLHSHQAGLGEVLPTWQFGQGAARALPYIPNAPPRQRGLPRRRSRYLRSSALPLSSDHSPIVTSGAAALADGAEDPMQRWRNSPPETEPASLSAIADAVKNTPLRGQSSNGSLNSRRSNFGAGSTVSFASDSSLSSGSATSASFIARRNRESKRGRLAAGKAKAAEKRRFPCTFCCDSFKSKFDWARHEQSLHVRVQGWRCAPFGSVVTSAATGSSCCAYCGLEDPTPTHIESHDSPLCGKDQMYARKDHLVQHLNRVHRVPDPPSIDTWKVQGPPVSSRCGFCNLRMETWQERADHLVSHFRKGKTMEDWKGEHGFPPEIAAQVTNAIPPYFIASESRTYAPFSAGVPNPTSAEHLQQITRSAEESFEAWNGPEPSTEPMVPLQHKSFPELLAFHLGRFAQHQMRLGVIPTDKMFQDEARRLQFGTVDPLDDTVADNEEWLSLFRSQHLDDSPSGQNRLV